MKDLFSSKKNDIFIFLEEAFESLPKKTRTTYKQDFISYRHGEGKTGHYWSIMIPKKVLESWYSNSFPTYATVRYFPDKKIIAIKLADKGEYKLYVHESSPNAYKIQLSSSKFVASLDLPKMSKEFDSRDIAQCDMKNGIIILKPYLNIGSTPIIDANLDDKIMAYIKSRSSSDRVPVKEITNHFVGTNSKEVDEQRRIAVAQALVRLENEEKIFISRYNVVYICSPEHR